jgi:hypothetical protein
MNVVFYDEVFEAEAEELLPDALAQLPPAAKHRAGAFPKLKMLVKSKVDPKYSIRYEFLLFRAPDAIENNKWNVVSATRCRTPEPPKEQKTK